MILACLDAQSDRTRRLVVHTRLTVKREVDVRRNEWKGDCEVRNVPLTEVDDRIEPPYAALFGTLSEVEAVLKDRPQGPPVSQLRQSWRLEIAGPAKRRDECICLRQAVVPHLVTLNERRRCPIQAPCPGHAERNDKSIIFASNNGLSNVDLQIDKASRTTLLDDVKQRTRAAAAERPRV